MKRKEKILPQYRADLAYQLQELGISRHEVADRAGITYRAVGHFFEGKSESRKVVKAAVALIKERSSDALRSAVEKHTKALELI